MIDFPLSSAHVDAPSSAFVYVASEAVSIALELQTSTATPPFGVEFPFELQPLRRPPNLCHASEQDEALSEQELAEVKAALEDPAPRISLDDLARKYDLS
jgi:hypothetical protein